MKKLMITAAALLTACVVGAAADGGTKVSGTDFESYTVGALNPALDDEGDSDQGTYWSTTQIGESEVKEEASNKFLAIDESVPLYRNMFKSNENQQSETVDADQSVYFSSKVKFTVSEDASMTPNSGDKLIVWLRSVDGEGPTNLIVTAYNSVEEGAQDYVIDNKTISDDAFHTLNIVASADDGAVKFTVSVDGDVLSSDGVTEFQSLVRSGSGIDTITCAGFKGSGAIDDIEFGTIEENPTKYYEVDGVEYIEFADALEAAATAQDSTIKLVNDAILNYNGVAGAGFYNRDDLVIDLAGCTISCEGVVFGNEGTLTILDTVGGGSVENTAENAENSIENYGGDVYISGGMYLGAVYNDDDTGSIVVTLDGDSAELVLDEDSESATYGYYIIEAKAEPPAPTVVQIPTAASNLTYDGTEKTGVAAGTGYTLTGTAAATNAGEYTATATLEEGYIWSDDTTEAKVFNWLIAPKTDAEVVVTLTFEIAEYSAQLEFPTASATIGGDDVAGTPTWNPAEITEPNAGETNTYTVIFAVTTANYAGSTGTATFKVWKAESEDPVYPSYIDNITDPAEKAAYEAKYSTWATTYSVADGAGNEEAFLLNCAPADVETAKANFKIPSITVDAQGNVTVGEIEGTFNGKLQLKGSTDLSTWTNLNAASKDYNFFKYELTY